MLHIQTILHPTDLSAAADQALQVAQSLARDHGARLVLGAAALPPLPVTEQFLPDTECSGLIDAAQCELEAVAAKVTGISVDSRVVAGMPGPSIVKLAEDCNADLIVMGTHGRSGISRLLVGSVAEYVMRHARCPVLTVQARTRSVTPIKTILHPTDFSINANQALQVAHALARDHHAVLVLAAVPPLPPPPYKYPFPPGQVEYGSVVQETRQQIESLAAAVVDVPVTSGVYCGLPGPAILAAAQEHSADLVVMGTHGRTGVSRLLMGSVAEHMIRHAPCPVLTIKFGTSAHLSHEEETALAVSTSI